MNIFPRFHFYFSSPLTLEQAFHTALHTDIELARRDYRCEECGGESGELLFYPERKRSFLPNFFLPVVHLFFENGEGSSEIALVARMGSKMSLFLSVFILIGIINQIGLLVLCAVRRTAPEFYVFLPAVVSAAAYLIALTGLRVTSVRFAARLRERLTGC